MSATYTYGVTAQKVAREVPGVDPSNINASGGKVTTTDLTAWISEGAGTINAMLDRSGIVAGAAMDADAHAAVGAAVKSYAVFTAMAVLGKTGPIFDQAQDRWNTVFAAYSNRPQMLGTAYNDGYTTSIDTDTKADDWSFVNSEGSTW